MSLFNHQTSLCCNFNFRGDQALAPISHVYCRGQHLPSLHCLRRPARLPPPGWGSPAPGGGREVSGGVVGVRPAWIYVRLNPASPRTATSHTAAAWHHNMCTAILCSLCATTPKRGFYCADFIRQRPLIPRVYFKIKATRYKAQLSGYVELLFL